MTPTSSPSQDPNTVLKRKIAEVFEPLLEPRRYKGAKGGRAGAKSHFFGEQLIEEMCTMHIRAIGIRETQLSIADSSKQLMEDKIRDLGVSHLFKITEKEIIAPEYESVCVFRGMKKVTAGGVKSMEGFNRAWPDEAQQLSQRSIDYLYPTIRKKGAEIWFSWNPEYDTDPVDMFFANNKNDPDFICVESTYLDNPWCPDEMRRDAERDRRNDYDRYSHIWLGSYMKNSEARVFKNWQVRPFESPVHTFFMQGADWGYAVDPSVLVRGFFGRWEGGQAVPDLKGSILFVDHEAYKVGVELDDTPAFFDNLIKFSDGRTPDLRFTRQARSYPLIADSSNPQAISYLRRHGYPRIRKSIKGVGSIKEGVKFLQGYNIVVHPRCKHTVDELNHFLYEIDPHTNIPTNELPKKKNHVIDALRYMVEPARRNRGATRAGVRT